MNISLLTYVIFASSLSTKAGYLQYSIDWVVELASITPAALTIPMAGSLYAGLCLYINGMVMDMKAKLSYADISSADELHGASRYLIYVHEIDFHNEIIRHDFVVIFNAL